MSRGGAIQLDVRIGDRHSSQGNPFEEERQRIVRELNAISGEERGIGTSKRYRIQPDTCNEVSLYVANGELTVKNSLIMGENITLKG